MSDPKTKKKTKKPRVDTKELATPTKNPAQREPLSPIMAGAIEKLDSKDFMRDAEAKLQELRTLMNKKKTKLKACSKLIDELKLIMIKFQLPPAQGESPEVVEKQLTFARETLEQSVLLAVKKQDFKLFERNFAQLKPYYSDYSRFLRESERHWPLVGLNLLGLLAHNRIAEFHTELELIPPEDREKMYISYSMELEQKLMEGAYSKILNASSRLPVQSYAYFTDILMNTVREKISDCTEKAYKDIPLDEAASVFLLAEKKEDVVLALIKKRNWQLRDTTIIFPHNTNSVLEVPNLRLVRQSLEYASELERII